MTQQDAIRLARVLKSHSQWLQNKAGERANLSGANLAWAKLSKANLAGAKLSKANLSGADLSGANLAWADLSGVDLYGANLSGANLAWAKLSKANLAGANLAWAKLSKANLSGADLSGVDLYLAINIPEAVRLLTQIVPDTGAFTAWKKLRDDIVAELAVPARAKRSNATGRKCRVSEARVKALYDKDGHPVTEGRSLYDESFIYTAGCTVKPQEAFDDNRWNECGSGIFCFITRAEAEAF